MTAGRSAAKLWTMRTSPRQRHLLKLLDRHRRGGTTPALTEVASTARRREAYVRSDLEALARRGDERAEGYLKDLERQEHEQTLESEFEASVDPVLTLVSRSVVDLRRLCLLEGSP